MNWIDITFSITGTLAVFLALTKYFGKKFIDISFQKEIESHKQLLNVKTESLKNELAIYANEQTTRFNRLDEKRAEVLEQIYEKIYDIQRIIFDGLEFNSEHGDNSYNNLHHSNDLTKQLSSSIRDLSFYRGKKRIYFTSELDDLVSRACYELTIVRERTYTEGSINNLNEKEVNILEEEILLKWREVFRSYNENFEPLKAELTSEFRKFLGVK
jgi:hypothetical protein